MCWRCQITPTLLDKVIGDRMGLGETGEVLIVGKDGLLRSDSSFTPSGDALQVEAGEPGGRCGDRRQAGFGCIG